MKATVQNIVQVPVVQTLELVRTLGKPGTNTHVAVVKQIQEADGGFSRRSFLGLSLMPFALWQQVKRDIDS